MIDPDDFPEWLTRQRGVRYRSDAYAALAGTWENKKGLIRRYADHLAQQGEQVTLERIREMLRYIDRGYSLKPDQIGFALAGKYKQGQVERYSQGKRVTIEGTVFSSVRRAAIALRVSPQTVLNRINSPSAAWGDWRFQE